MTIIAPILVNLTSITQ